VQIDRGRERGAKRQVMMAGPEPHRRQEQHLLRQLLLDAFNPP
jgi:hypothetical protein